MFITTIAQLDETFVYIRYLEIKTEALMLYQKSSHPQNLNLIHVPNLVKWTACIFPKMKWWIQVVECHEIDISLVLATYFDAFLVEASIP